MLDHDRTTERIVPATDHNVATAAWNGSAALITLLDTSPSMDSVETQAAVKEVHARTARHYFDRCRRLELHTIAYGGAVRTIEGEVFPPRCGLSSSPASAAIRLAAETIAEERFTERGMKIFLLHISDGENSLDDDRACLDILWRGIMPVCAGFDYIEIRRELPPAFRRTTSYLWGMYAQLASDYNDKVRLFDGDVVPMKNELYASY